MKYTLHMHTIGFDGRNSVAEMVNRARELGFDTIGISNHFIVNPDIKNTKMYSYSVRGGYSNIYSENFDEVLMRFVPLYYEIEHIAEQNPDIKILRGMEVDFFNNTKWLHGFERVMQILNPDYIIGAAHLVEYNGMLTNTHDWKKADKQTQDIFLKNYWNKVKNAAESGLFTFMAHLDLPKKVNLGRDEKWMDYENRAVESVAHTGGAIEINTSFYRSYLYEPYPSNRILEMIKNANVPVLISDDAHEVKNIGRHFDMAHQLITNFHLQTLNKIK